MLQIFQEAELPKLTETSLYIKFNETSQVTQNIQAEIKQSSQTVVSPDKIPEIVAMIRLNGDAVAKKAVEAYQNGDIVIIHNKATSKVPSNLPYVIISGSGGSKAYIFADKVVNNITSPSEYTNLMAVLEAAYVALLLKRDSSAFLMNSQLMLTLCNIYALMVAAPLEQKLYMKGDNLNKAMLYIIAYFYRMTKGENLTVENVPYKRIMQDKIDQSVAEQVIEEIKSDQDMSFMGLIKKIIKINPIRYKDLDTMYLSYFTSTCGVSLIFALENLAYLFLLISSAAYKTGITGFGLNKIVAMPCKKAVVQMSPIIQ